MTQRELYQAFQQAFPVGKLKDMSLDEYTNLNKEDSFCYWLESRTYDLGSFWGGSSYKFLIYRYNKRPAEGDPRVISDEQYAWYSNLGKDTAEEAYKVVRDEIVKVAELATAGDFEAIDERDRLGHSYKWKIAFLYSNEQLVPIYNRGMLNVVARELGMKNAQKVKTVEIQRFLMKQKGDKDLYEFYGDLLKILESKSQANSFENVKAAMIEKLEDNNRFVAKKAGKEYLWIGTKDGLIGYDACHYEIVNDGSVKAGHKKSLVFVEMHHEGRKAKLFKDLQTIDGVKTFRWTIYGERINETGWDIKDRPIDELTDDLIQALCELDDLVGEKARAIIKENSETPADGKQYWWLSAKPKIWSIAGMKVGEEQDYTLYNERGNKRKIFQNFLDARAGDIVIGYEATPTKQIVGLLEISRAADDKSIYFKMVEKLPSPIDLSLLKSTPELENMEYMKNPQGSLFKVNPDEFDVIMDMIREDNPVSKEEAHDAYDRKMFLDEVFISYNDYNQLESLLLRKKNLILQGAPGVGKTFAAKRLAYAIMGEKDDSRVLQVQFHQNYSYEDFVMGYKPNEDGGFELKNGIFYKFCKRAAADMEHKYFFIIDEINRGNLSKIFGELLMLIECDYRDKPIQMSYREEHFSVPSNVFIIGMMNTADRSLAMIDYALRRRFSFFEMKPGFESAQFEEYVKKLLDPHLEKLVKAIIELNKVIAADDSLGSGFCIGHSYLCELGFHYDLESIVEYDIIPMLREYWFDNDEKYNLEAQKLRNSLKI
jgi:predicted RNA-binding protein with PUA-like domain